MFTLRRLFSSGLISLILAGAGLAQETRIQRDNPQEPTPPVQASPLVTASATAKRVRFVSPGTVVQLRLEVYNEAGQKVFDTELRGGNVLDWHLQDGSGERVAAGSYASVLTTKSLSGRLSQRMSVVRVSEKKVGFEVDESAQLSLAQQQTIGPMEANGAIKILQSSDTEALTTVTHDGTDGQLTSSAGALTFRTGDLFAGKDKEHMRITEEGRVGIGTDKPEATLDVAGTVKVSEGIKFSDGTTLQASSGKLKVRDAGGEVIVESAAQGTGSLNRLAKWSETGGAGTLTDAAGAEVSGLTIFGQNASSEVAPLFPTAANHHVLEVGAPGAKSPLVLAGGSGVMEFWKDLGGGTGAPAAAVAFGMARPGLLATNDMVFSTYVSGQPWNERLRLTSAGNVGIGTNNPTAKLHVVGAVNFTGLRTFENATSPNVVGGHSGNLVMPNVVGATIGGGGDTNPNAGLNRVTDDFGTVGGGRDNRAGDDNVSTVDKPSATVGGGFKNIASGDRSTVSGGSRNTASGAFSTVGGGDENTASNMFSTVGGGADNIASGNYSIVLGGKDNIAAGAFSFAAGFRAKANQNGTFVWADETLADFSSTANNQFLIRAGGGVGINTNSTSAATLNVNGSGLFTGDLTVNGNIVGTLPAGSGNYIQNNPASPQSGSFNISGNGTLGGTLTAGAVNFIGLRTQTALSPNVIGGNINNVVTPGVAAATIAGGGFNTQPNVVTDHYGTIGGGGNNRAGDDAGETNDHQFGTVGGGFGNTASGSSSTVGGGSSNTASHSRTTVGGGQFNTASSFASTVGGGNGNTASGEKSTVPGGENNTAAGQYSFAAGRQAKALNQGSFVWADSTNASFTSNKNDAFLIRATGGVGIGTNAPANLLHVSGAGTTSGGCCGASPTAQEVVGHFIQPSDTAHSAVSVDASGATGGQPLGRDSILYFAKGGTAIWGFRNDADAGDKFQLRYHGAGGVDESVSRLTIQADGNVGLGTNSPARKLHISDAMRLQPIASPPASPASGDLYFDTSEALCVYVNSAWTKLAGTGTCQ